MQPSACTSQDGLAAETRAFYQDVLSLLTEARAPFLVGGAYAFSCRTGIHRHTKDLDLFVKEADCQSLLDVLEAAGYATEMKFPHWLAKAHEGDDFVDLIYSSGNGVATVDDEWFAHAVPGEVLGMQVLLCPPEETIWSKGFVLERERYDGADVAHLLRSCAASMDWPRLLRRFGPHWRVLLSHLILFGFVYPTERTQVPAWVMRELLGRLGSELDTPAPPDGVCYGTLLSREQYLKDIQSWGYRDARLAHDLMSRDERAIWTADINGKGHN
jgi:hypothetical protein